MSLGCLEMLQAVDPALGLDAYAKPDVWGPMQVWPQLRRPLRPFGQDLVGCAAESDS